MLKRNYYSVIMNNNIPNDRIISNRKNPSHLSNRHALRSLLMFGGGHAARTYRQGLYVQFKTS